MLWSHSTVRSHVFRKLFMESVLLKANLVNLSTGQYWLKSDREKGMSDREGHGHKAVLYKSHFLPLRHQLLERHHCIQRLINHVYTQRPKTHYISLPHDKRDNREMQSMPGEFSSIEHGKVQVHQHSASTSMAYTRHGPLLLQKTRLSRTHRLLLEVPHSS